MKPKQEIQIKIGIKKKEKKKIEPSISEIEDKLTLGTKKPTPERG